jgi:hypothetical protein
MEPWYKQLGFKDNPLDARPNSTLVGIQEKEDQLKNFIVKEQLCFLHGLTGAGKTSLLKRVQESMPNHTFIYLDADAVPEEFDLTAAIQGKRTFLDKIRFRDMPDKKPVLIIDEFQATDNRLVLEARSKWENPTERQIKSIVIAQISDQLKNTPGSFKDRLGNRMIHLHPLENAAMKEVLQKRLGSSKQGRNYFDQLSDKTVDFLVTVADGNARRLLEFTEMLFEYHWQRFNDRNPVLHKEDYKIQFPAAKEILSVNNIAVDGYIEAMGKKKVDPAIDAIKKKHISKKEHKKGEKETVGIEHSEVKQNEAVKKQGDAKNVEEKESYDSINGLPHVAPREVARVSDTFDHEFTIAEQNVLRALLRHDRMTLKQVATNIHLEIHKCNGVIANLKKKGAVVGAGKKNKEKSWQITQSAKRALVTK